MALKYYDFETLFNFGYQDRRQAMVNLSPDEARLMLQAAVDAAECALARKVTCDDDHKEVARLGQLVLTSWKLVLRSDLDLPTGYDRLRVSRVARGIDNQLRRCGFLSFNGTIDIRTLRDDLNWQALLHQNLPSPAYRA